MNCHVSRQVSPKIFMHHLILKSIVSAIRYEMSERHAKTDAIMKSCIRTSLYLALLLASLATGASMAGQLQVPLTIVTNPYPPVSYEENGKVTGVTTAIVTEIFNRMGQPIELQVNPLARSLAMVNNGTAAGIFAIQKTPDREKIFDFSEAPIFQDAISLFADKSSNFQFDGAIKSLVNETVCLNIAAKHGPEFDRAIAEKKLTKMTEVKDFTQCLRMLRSNRVSLVIGPRSVVLHTAQKMATPMELRELRPPVNTGAEVYFAFGRAKDLTALKQRFNAVFKEMKADGTYDKILSNYGVAPLTSRQ